MFVRNVRHLGTIVTLGLAIALAGCAGALQPAASPETVGLSSERLKALGGALQAGVEKKEIPGAVMLVARHGRVAYFESFGYRDREAGVPMTRDSIFRIASLTKPITTLAAMMLVEEGKLDLSAPVSRYLPEFRETKVGVEKKGGDGTVALVLEAPQREMTVRDLMRHTSGISYDLAGQSLVKAQYAKVNVRGVQSNAEFVSRLAQVPLHDQPGTVWDYSFSTDVLGRIVEVLSGMELGEFFAQRIFKPLGMTETAFWVADPGKHGRIAQAQADPTTGNRPTLPDRTKKGWQSGGGALVSTAPDYARFCQMLLNGGELDGARLVSRKTIDQMTRNDLPEGIRIVPLRAPVADVRPEAGNGFGLGFLVRTADGRSPVPGTVGDYSWVGIFGPYFWIDPKNDLFAIFMMQVPPPAGAVRVKYWTEVRRLVYAALVK